MRGNFKAPYKSARKGSTPITKSYQGTPNRGALDLADSKQSANVSRVALADISEAPISQDGPQSSGDFTYIDIGSIDRETKRIVGPKVLSSSKAPSRAKQVLKAGDILVSMTRPNLNAVALVPPNLDGAIGSTGFHVLRAKNAQPGFLLYAVQTPQFIDTMCQKVQGALYPAVRPKDVSSFCIRAPSAEEQQRIVAELEKQFTQLEAGVATLRRVQTNLKRYRAAVLKAACDGTLASDEAVKSPNKHNFDENPLKSILAERRHRWTGRGKYEEPVSTDTSNLPSLPEGWIWTNLDTVIVSGPQNGVYLPRTLYGHGYPILRIDDYQDGWTRSMDKLKRVTADPATADKYQLFADDLIINRVNSMTHLGKCMTVKSTHAGALFESNIMKIRLVYAVNPRYVTFYLQSRAGRDRLIRSAKWAVNQASINQRDVKGTPLPLPPLAEQVRIAAEVDRRFSLVAELEASVSTNLFRGARLRQSILDKAFREERA